MSKEKQWQPGDHLTVLVYGVYYVVRVISGGRSHYECQILHQNQPRGPVAARLSLTLAQEIPLELLTHALADDDWTPVIDYALVVRKLQESGHV